MALLEPERFKTMTMEKIKENNVNDIIVSMIALYTKQFITVLNES